MKRTPLQRLASLRNWAQADLKGQRMKLRGLRQAKLIREAHLKYHMEKLDELSNEIDYNYHEQRKNYGCATTGTP